MRNTWGADVYLHFGMHGALDLLPPDLDRVARCVDAILDWAAAQMPRIEEARDRYDDALDEGR